MSDERYYCVRHRVPVEWIDELQLYVCGRCEDVYSREEVIPARILEQSIDDLILIKSQEVKQNGNVKRNCTGV